MLTHMPAAFSFTLLMISSSNFGCLAVNLDNLLFVLISDFKYASMSESLAQMSTRRMLVNFAWRSTFGREVVNIRM